LKGTTTNFWIALGVVAGGVGLRMYGLDYGLPFIYIGDELEFVGRALHMLGTRDPNPHWFGHPGTPTIYLFALSYAVKLSAGSTSLADLFYLSRALVVVFAAGSIVLTYVIGARVAGRSVGLLGAALLAVAPLHVQYSRIARPDVQMTFFVLASAWFIISVADKGRWRDYIRAGLLLGIAVATKYPALVLALGIVWAHALNRLKHQQPIWTHLSRLISSGLATCAGFIAGTPYILVEYENAWASLIRESRPFHLSATSEGFMSSLSWYLANPLLANAGVLGMLMVLAGAWSIVRNRDANQSILLVFPITFVIFISFLSLRWARWAIPALPFIGLLAAIGFRQLYALLSARVVARAPHSLRHILPVAALIAAIVLIAAPAASSLVIVKGGAGGDTRTTAWQWIMDNVPPGSRVLAEASTPQLPHDTFRLYRIQDGRIIPNNDQSRLYIIPLRYNMPVGSLGELTDVRLIDRMQIDYLVMSDDYDRRRAESFHPGQEALYAELKREVAMYEEIMNQYELIYEDWPVRGKIAGTRIRIYRTTRMPGREEDR